MSLVGPEPAGVPAGPAQSGGSRADPPVDPASYPGRRSPDPGHAHPTQSPANPCSRRTFGLDLAAVAAWRAALQDDRATVRLTATCLPTN